MMHKTRILFLDHNADVAGGQKSLLALIDSIDRSQFELLAAAPTDASALIRELTKRSVPVLNIGFGRRENTGENPLSRGMRKVNGVLAALASAIRLAILCRRRRIDVIHANSIASALVAAPVRLFSSARTAVRVRSGLLYSNHGLLDIIVLKTADAILCNSHYVRKTIAHRLEGQVASVRARVLEKSHVIYNPMPWRSIKHARRAVRGGGMPAALRNGRLNIGVVGRITERKRQHVAVEALKRLIAEGVDAHLWILGDPSPIDGGRYAREVERRVRESNLASHVTFTGFVDDVFPWLGGLDMVLMPSVAEPLSRAIYEAQAMGATVIAANDAGNAELITDNENGLLFRPDDAHELAARIKVARTQEKRAQLGWRALMRVARTFASERTVDREMRLLRTIAAAPSLQVRPVGPRPAMIEDFSNR